MDRCVGTAKQRWGNPFVTVEELVGSNGEPGGSAVQHGALRQPRRCAETTGGQRVNFGKSQRTLISCKKKFGQKCLFKSTKNEFRATKVYKVDLSKSFLVVEKLKMLKTRK